MAKKIVSSDIYNLIGLVDDIKKQFIPEETEATLAVSTYGYIGAIEAKRLQTQVIMTGELANEAFPSRSRMERNVITHAITSGINDINAVPSKMNVILGIRQSDLQSLMNSDIFTLDRENAIYIGDFEFHLEYDIIIKKITIAGNEQVYTAQYDMTRENPSSEITNPYISSPSVILLENETYIFINMIISQVEHYTEYKKTTTSNVIDNKTVNFEFQNQLAYFEVHIIESDDDKYITPLFEGSGIPDGTTYYCWYQYIDTNTIRVRFDRNSYMPGLNAEIEILIKTTRGAEANFSYKDDIFVTFESSKYGYKNLSVLLKPSSDSEDGKNKKSKTALQRGIAKEALSRGSLTNIKDLNNYFAMIDSEYGRIVVQKKIDNQRERIYYAYLLLKDLNNDIVPSNTVDLKIPMSALIKTTISDSASPRYVLRAGSCFRLMNDNITCELVKTPIKNLGLQWTTQDISANTLVSFDFSVRISSDEYPSMNCRALIGDKSSRYIESPLYESSIYAPEDNSNPVNVENGMLVSIGQKLKFVVEYTAVADGSLTFTNPLHDGFDYIKDTTVYYAGTDTTPYKIDPIDGDYKNLKFVIADAIKDKKYKLIFDVKTNEKMEVTVQNITSVENGSESKSLDPITIHSIVLTMVENPQELLYGNLLTYHVEYMCGDILHTPIMFIELSRGVVYVTKSGTITIEGKGSYIEEPIQTDLIEDAGFLYTNPYSIVINHYNLYSTFYMMCVNMYPYIHFEYINQKSAIQFIGTNVSWNRSFLGYNKNKYIMQMEITQSVAKDMGIIVKHEATPTDPAYTEYKIKMIALLYRDGVPYRYKNLSLDSADETTYSYNFSAEFEAVDILDQNNNIKINKVGLLNQLEEDYGFFNPTTTVKIYTLCQISDTEGKYTRYNIDAYVPGLDGWTVTNMYDVVNGINFYYNYAEIMSSRVTPYGSTEYDDDLNANILTPDGYYVKGVPVFGYDYCRDETLVNNAIDALNDRKLYIDDALSKQENSFGMDFKHFNTYGPSNIFYIIRDTNSDNILDEKREFIDRVNVSAKFRIKLRNSNDTYTKTQIIKYIKDYMEDLNELDEIHFPDLVTQINTTYSESLVYFEFLGINDYGPGVQHLYKLADSEIPIHVCPEFININNLRSEDQTSLEPDITIYVSES